MKALWQVVGAIVGFGCGSLLGWAGVVVFAPEMNYEKALWFILAGAVAGLVAGVVGTRLVIAKTASRSGAG